MKALVFLLLLLFAAPASAAPDLADVGFTPHVGAQVPLDRPFLDEAGRPVRLGDLLRGRPAVLDLGYYHCPSLCGVVRSDTLTALKASGLRPGIDYVLLNLSIDPHERPQDAAAAKADDLARYPVPGAAGAWHFLTGPSEAVQESVGFRARYDDALEQYLHPTGIVLLTPTGMVSGYLMGVGYTPANLRADLRRAAAAVLAPPPPPVLLLCFHYDPTTGRYSLAIERVLELMGGATVLLLGGWLALSHARRRA